ncbi:MAG TPA: DinB family protein [Pyrinomonadaceae bacterium]|nr:DinB family protein [Pyrinomonadaceae bacterium]
MPNLLNTRPDPSEYVSYYGKYIALVPEGDILVSLSGQMKETLALLKEIPEERAGHRYAPDKWSIKEVIGHLIDTERVFAYRAMRFGRGDETPLPGFDQDEYIRNASFDSQQLSDLAAEFEHVRLANILLFRHLKDEAWGHRGAANDSPVSVRALAYIIAGHELHHREIIRSKYLQNGA